MDLTPQVQENVITYSVGLNLNAQLQKLGASLDTLCKIDCFLDQHLRRRNVRCEAVLYAALSFRVEIHLQQRFERATSPVAGFGGND